jgi:hypothetical protein
MFQGELAMTLDKTGTDIGAFRRNSGDRIQNPMQGPMSQQASFGSHGYDMHPQKFVRLVGCQSAEPVKPRAALYERSQPRAA